MYTQIYNLFVQYVYGAVTLTEWMDLTATLFSSLACLFCVALPFMVVWRLIKAIC